MPPNSLIQATVLPTDPWLNIMVPMEEGARKWCPLLQGDRERLQLCSLYKMLGYFKR